MRLTSPASVECAPGTCAPDGDGPGAARPRRYLQSCSELFPRPRASPKTPVYRNNITVSLIDALAVAVPIVLWALHERTGKPVLLWAYGAYAALIVFWFGFLDGFLDHVAKAAGMENTTFLPGGDEAIVGTAMQLWSQPATTAFYEGTGILSAFLSLLTVITTGIFLFRNLPARSETRQKA